MDSVVVPGVEVSELVVIGTVRVPGVVMGTVGVPGGRVSVTGYSGTGGKNGSDFLLQAGRFFGGLYTSDA